MGQRTDPKIYTPIALTSFKKIPECNVLIGSCEPLIKYAEKILKQRICKVSLLDDSMIFPDKLYLVDHLSQVQVTQEKIQAKLGTWVADSLEPGTLAVKELVEEACKLAGIKPSTDLVTSVGWKFFEGVGEILSIEQALIEAVAWVQLPLDPKPVLPWEDSTGFFRLSQVERELKGYKAWQEDDLDKMKALGCKESRVSRWNLDPVLVEQTLTVLSHYREGFYEEDLVKSILSTLWSTTVKTKTPETKKKKKKK